MTEPSSGTEKPIFDQYPQWRIEPVGGHIGWTATQATGNGHVHVVAAPTIRELRLKLREVTSRKARP